ncbi:MAG: hypothetical protein M1825_002383 [Sarcosagium campestre]|nr:MAG: hypothetical protein M1825_002383 [Sarcosagium campestre]
MEGSRQSEESQRGLLRSKQNAAHEASVRDSYESSDDDLSLNELDPLQNDATSSARSKEAAESGASRRATGTYDSDKTSHQETLGKAGRQAWRWRKWIFIVALLSSAFLVLMAGGGYWAYKVSPNDGRSPPWYPTPLGGTVPAWDEAYSKAQKMVSRMSLIEKVNVTTGTGWMSDLCVGNTGPANDVKFPALCLQDGPMGLRFADRITQFPAGITTGATWNKKLMYERGRALGREARGKGINVLLGPLVGPLGKLPAGGRNWEGFGADPVLQGVAAVETIRGIQEEGVIASIKHYILNEQEHFRQAYEWGLPHALSANIDDRTLHELYLWPFAEAVRAEVGSVMCSYQMVNNSYACGNSKLLNGILKDELGFQGWVVSDWLAARSGVASALSGLDVTMPGEGLRWHNGESLWGSHLTMAVLNHSLPMSRLDDMVTRVVATWYKFGQDTWASPPPDGDEGPNFSSWSDEKEDLLHPGTDDLARATVNRFVDVRGGKGAESHANLTRRIAAEGTVLVKNDGGILPLSRDGHTRKNDNDDGTSSKLRIGIYGEDAGKGRDPLDCVDSGCNKGTLAVGWGSGSVSSDHLVSPSVALMSVVDPKRVYVTAYPSDDPPFDKSPDIITQQDICIVFVKSNGGEGYIAVEGIRGDRNDLFVQHDGERLVRNVAEKCGDGSGHTIVVIHSVGPVIVENFVDIKGVKALVFANLPGQESGDSLTDVLFGDVNPSGKLPYTIGRSLEDYGEQAQVLYYPNAIVPQQDFTGYIDYQDFEKNGVDPRYEFGFGLSYTKFEMSQLSVVLTQPKSAFPSKRLPGSTPPAYSGEIPSASQAVFPSGFRRLKKYIYSYVESDEIEQSPYPYPNGYNVKQPLSGAGGGQGGNPNLFETHATVSIELKNTGKVAGQEVVQVYVSLNKTITETGEDLEYPIKVLRSFEKVALEPGASQNVKLNLTRKDLSYWSTIHQNWIMPTGGKFTILVGNSSRNLPLRAEL